MTSLHKTSRKSAAGILEVYESMFKIMKNLEFLHDNVQRRSVKKVFLDISQNSPENNWARASFLIKLQASGLRQREFDTGIFLLRLWNF